MAPQQIETLETIAALKWKLRRDRQPPTDDPIAVATNRGNKLKKGANNVHAGALPYPHGPSGYKEQIEHAGYTRYILARNPKRHNEYGYELDDSESDAEADADAEDENAYSGVRIEELLRPLTHPSELATHPTLSTPYLDSSLPDMVKSVEEKLRQERANLWRAKMLHRQLVGDENWVPCGAFETPDDWDLFEPRRLPVADEARERKRKHSEPANADETGATAAAAAADSGPDTVMQNGNDETATNGVVASSESGEHANGDISMLSAPEATETTDATAETTAGTAETADTAEEGAKPSVETENEEDNEEDDDKDKDHESEKQEDDENASSAGSTAPPPRRITRALAAENTSTVPTPPLSPSPSETTVDSALLTTDPLFLIPPLFGTQNRLPGILEALQLPVEELLDTRRLLFMYIQKQEESVRGFEAVLGKLIKATRMKDQLWEMCKAEGHLGECSDGEDWIDAAAWGERQEDLKKGRDEDDVMQEEEGRKGKRRRVRDRDRDRE